MNLSELVPLPLPVQLLFALPPSFPAPPPSAITAASSSPSPSFVTPPPFAAAHHTGNAPPPVLDRGRPLKCTPMDQVYLQGKPSHPAALIVGAVRPKEHVSVCGANDEGEAAVPRPDELAHAADVHEGEPPARVGAMRRVSGGVVGEGGENSPPLPPLQFAGGGVGANNPPPTHTHTHTRLTPLRRFDMLPVFSTFLEKRVQIYRVVTINSTITGDHSKQDRTKYC